MTSAAPALGITFVPTLPPEDLHAMAVAAEEAGLDELWVWEDCFKESAIASAAAALAWTSRLRVGIGLLPVPLRNVALTAMELASLERMFPGRLIAGVGHGVQFWMEQVGASVRGPARRGTDAWVRRVPPPARGLLRLASGLGPLGALASRFWVCSARGPGRSRADAIHRWPQLAIIGDAPTPGRNTSSGVGAISRLERASVSRRRCRAPSVDHVDDGSTHAEVDAPALCVLVDLERGQVVPAPWRVRRVRRAGVDLRPEAGQYVGHVLRVLRRRRC